MKEQLQDVVLIRTYDFQHGILHLERAAVQHMTDEEVAEEYAASGPLLNAWDNEMSAEEFFALPDFRDC